MFSFLVVRPVPSLWPWREEERMGGGRKEESRPWQWSLSGFFFLVSAYNKCIRTVLSFTACPSEHSLLIRAGLAGDGVGWALGWLGRGLAGQWDDWAEGWLGRGLAGQWDGWAEGWRSRGLAQEEVVQVRQRIKTKFQSVNNCPRDH